MFRGLKSGVLSRNLRPPRPQIRIRGRGREPSLLMLLEAVVGSKGGYGL